MGLLLGKGLVAIRFEVYRTTNAESCPKLVPDSPFLASTHASVDAGSSICWLVT